MDRRHDPWPTPKVPRPYAQYRLAGNSLSIGRQVYRRSINNHCGSGWLFLLPFGQMKVRPKDISDAFISLLIQCLISVSFHRTHSFFLFHSTVRTGPTKSKHSVAWRWRSGWVSNIACCSERGSNYLINQCVRCGARISVQKGRDARYHTALNGACGGWPGQTCESDKTICLLVGLVSVQAWPLTRPGLSPTCSVFRGGGGYRVVWWGREAAHLLSHSLPLPLPLPLPRTCTLNTY